MKKNINQKLAIVFLFLSIGIFQSCSLDEQNRTTVSLDKSYGERSGFEGLIDSCYENLYFLYGKVDFIAPNEAGTDSWENVGSGGIGFAQYASQLNPDDGNLKVIWGTAYSTINLCNTAIYYATDVKGYATTDELNAKLAEAYFLRAFNNFLLVEQFGGVVLRTKSSIIEGVDNAPVRSSEEEFYNLIIEDLKFACTHLPTKQTLQGRIAKKAAYGLLAKVYLQRTRLGEVQKYAQLALETAEELINNPSKYNTALYVSDNTKSGFAKLWSGQNNKNNTEFLFTQGIDHVSGLNPEAWNRGRTRQYYLPDLATRGAEWGTGATSILYGRANSRLLKPSKYLLTEVFSPVESPADTRFAETFTFKFYAAAAKTITQAMATAYKKDASVVGYTIKNTLAQAAPAVNFYSQRIEEQVNMNNDEGLAVFTPNWTIDAVTKSKMPMLVADPSDLFEPGTNRYKDPALYPNDPNLINMFPAMRKFSAALYCQSNQYWLGDIPIIRLGEIYLIAAEAAILNGNDQNKAVGYVNTLRKRAALTSRENEMVVLASQINVDFLLKERARELTGEHMRWIDLKRMGKLNKAYLDQTNPIAGTNFVDGKHLVRPIPRSFLDAISNATQFGNNGY
ncbi:RagB/SusD family nutrient uptake outer membrane protein [Flavobacterium seoulense]|uniref:Carbohydrate-binding protein SusD n=1 Tax=Flavobacterium seoulense TaxID=1492738 RepID=A0A066WLU1_9FLAO|nr:RagB/SusD family nutrient uptake outer membrane protein [Flavobacterium seoulense]KDN54806.1 hypothetical protein FEM21_20570 [Flavobacterium seoulense]